MLFKRALPIMIFLSLLFADWHGQFSTFGSLGKESNGYISKFGLQYIPNWSITVPWPTAIYDAEISLNINTTYVQPQSGGRELAFNLKPYRMWLRKSTDIFELRFGLQKITFGNARIFRSLMWFDRIDPTDPLQITEGVWAVRAKRNFNNNSNIWMWGLLWNKEAKGWEIIPTKKNNVEFGGRFQFQVPRGEIGIAGHNRIISRRDVPEYLEINTMPKSTPEVRAAIDGYFDLGIGLWFESTILHADYGNDFPNWQTFLTIGSDYTLPIGNGITIIGEHFIYNQNDKVFSKDSDMNTSGLMVTYPVNIFDNISGFVFYSWDAKLTFYYLNWQRTYDDWTIILSTYFSSDSEANFSFNQADANFSNRGIQLMLIFNH